MKESTLWKQIARAYDKQLNDRTDWEQRLAATGLCNAAALACMELRWTGLWHRMDTRIEQHAIHHGLSTYGYWWTVWSNSRKPDLKRRDVALRFAKQAAAEEAKRSRRNRQSRHMIKRGGKSKPAQGDGRKRKVK